MILDRSGGQVLVVVLAVALTSLLVPGALAQEAGTSEQEPNDTPQNATLVQPGASVSGEITASSNPSQADADWFAFPVQKGQNVTATLESGSDAERLLVFLASPNGSRNVSAVNETLADATIAPSGSTTTVSATANESRPYFVGVTGLNGEYELVVETSGGMAMGQNGTNMTGVMNGTNETTVANASSTTTQVTSTTTATSIQTAETTTTDSTSTASTGTSGGDGGNASGEGTSASGPGFGLLAALVALVAAAMLIARRR